MFYGDLHLIDILIFAGIAAFLFFRLSGVLGKRTGFEKKHPDNRPVKQKEIKQTPAAKNEIPELEPGFEKLKMAYEVIKSFDHVEFLEGAKKAFEMIVTHFKNGSKDKLKPLLTKDIYSVFSKAIDENKTPNNMQMLSIKIESINKVETTGKKIFITVTYQSTQIDMEKDKQTSKKDIWTFEKQINDRNPGWLLCAT